MSQTNKRLIVLAFAAIIAVTATVWLLLPPYLRWSMNRAARSAVTSLAQTNYPNAVLSARRALQIDSNCIVACRVMAELHERSRSSHALQWRQRVLELEPQRDSNQLALARTALMFDRREVAREALLTFSEPAQRSTPEYHALAAQIAFADHQLNLAQEHLTAATRLDPTNAVYDLNLQIVRLHSPDSNVVRVARDQLDAFRSLPLHGAAITRALVREALIRSDLDRAHERSMELQQRPDAEFSDRLLHLTVLYTSAKRSSTPETNSPPDPHEPPLPSAASISEPERQFQSFLIRTESEAGLDPARISALAAWLIEFGLAAVAIPWLESFPDEIRSATAVRLALTECYLAQKNWHELGVSLEHSHWGADDHLRHAMLALVYRQQGNVERGQVEWKHAVHAANAGAHAGSRSRLALVRLAGAWSWEQESEELLWEIAGHGRENRWALAVLRHAYELGGDTRALVRVFQAMLKSDPQDLVAQNNLAATSLLVGTNLPTAHQLARQVFSAHPTNPSAACTYAYSMHLQGRTGEGLQLLSQFPETLNRNPTAAAYYGLLLSAQGSQSEAEKYLALGSRGHLLPEERALITKAQGK